MYEQAYKDIGKGLRLVFFGEILVTVASMFSWSVLSLAGLVLTLVGLSSAGRGDSGYRKAFAVTILNLAVTFAGGILAGVLLVFLPTYRSLISCLPITFVPQAPLFWRNGSPLCPSRRKAFGR